VDRALGSSKVSVRFVVMALPGIALEERPAQVAGVCGIGGWERGEERFQISDLKFQRRMQRTQTRKYGCVFEALGSWRRSEIVRAGSCYVRLILASATRMIMRLPSARAARVIVSRLIETFCGSSKRSSCDRLVRSCLAIACLVFCCFRMACESCQASTRLMATASTSSRIPSASRKLSKVEPLWPVLLRFFRPEEDRREPLALFLEFLGLRTLPRRPVEALGFSPIEAMYHIRYIKARDAARQTAGLAGTSAELGAEPRLQYQHRGDAG
jgi:hypothetical protein